MSIVIVIDANSVDAVKANRDLFDDAMKDVIDAWEVIKEAIIEAISAVAESLHPLLEAISNWYELTQRKRLLDRLEKRRIPKRVAVAITTHWPRAWLPDLESDNEPEPN